SEIPLEDKVRRCIRLYLDQFSATPFIPGYVIGELNQHPERANQFVAAIRRMRDEALGPDLFDTLDRQIRSRVRAGTLRRITTKQFVVNLASLCVFPFAARPMLCAMLDLDASGFQRLIAERRTALPRFF